MFQDFVSLMSKLSIVQGLLCQRQESGFLFQVVYMICLIPLFETALRGSRQNIVQIAMHIRKSIM